MPAPDRLEELHMPTDLVIDADAPEAQSAERVVRDMCAKLLANPVTEDFEIANVEQA